MSLKNRVGNFLILFGLIALSVFAYPPPSVRAATTWYVAPLGNDGHTCQSPAAACATPDGAIAKAASGDTILVAAGTYTGSGTAVVTIAKNLTLSGGWDTGFTSQAGTTIIDGQQARQGVLVVGVTATLDRFTIQHGDVNTYGNGGNGGGVNNDGGHLTLANSRILSNTARYPNSFGQGGGVNSRDGTLILVNSWVLSNTSSFGGGGINIASGQAQIIQTVIRGNQMDYQGSGGGGGAGLANWGHTRVERSSVHQNAIVSAFAGGGIWNAGVLSLTNTTLSQNSSSWYAGGLINSLLGQVRLSNVTLAHNQGEGLVNDGTLAARNSVLANNGGLDCVNSGTFTSLGYNLVESLDGCALAGTDVGGADPRLGLPHGDLVFYPLRLGSPALDGGHPAGCVDDLGTPLLTDQRGVARTGRCDIGAYEATFAYDKAVTGLFRPGGEVLYTVTLQDWQAGGPVAAAISDTLPSGLTYVPGSAAATSGVVTVTGSALVWAGTVISATPTVLTYRAQVGLAALGQTFTNTAHINWPGQPVLAQASFTLPNPLYLLSKHVTGDLRIGQVVTYTLELDSGSTGLDLTGAHVTDTLPAQLSILPGSLTATTGAASVLGQSVLWTGAVLSDTPTLITYQTFVRGGGEIENTAQSSWMIYPQSASTSFVALTRVFAPLAVQHYCPNFLDDFSQPGSGWPVGESELVLAQYLNGEYRVMSKQPFLFLFRSPACSRVNYVVEADLRWEGATGSDLGLLVGVSGDFSQYYFVDINTDFQAYAIYRRNVNGTFSFVAPPAQTAAIHGGTQSNHLKVTRQGNQLVLEINGLLVGAWNDSAIGGLTFAGVAMAPYDDAPMADARFDNFRVTNISASALALDGPAPSIASRPVAAGWPAPLPEWAPLFAPKP